MKRALFVVALLWAGEANSQDAMKEFCYYSACLSCDYYGTRDTRCRACACKLWNPEALDLFLCLRSCEQKDKYNKIQRCKRRC